MFNVINWSVVLIIKFVWIFFKIRLVNVAVNNGVYGLIWIEIWLSILIIV